MLSRMKRKTKSPVARVRRLQRRLIQESTDDNRSNYSPYGCNKSYHGAVSCIRQTDRWPKKRRTTETSTNINAGVPSEREEIPEEDLKKLAASCVRRYNLEESTALASCSSLYTPQPHTAFNSPNNTLAQNSTTSTLRVPTVTNYPSGSCFPTTSSCENRPSTILSTSRTFPASSFIKTEVTKPSHACSVNRTNTPNTFRPMENKAASPCPMPVANEMLRCPRYYSPSPHPPTNCNQFEENKYGSNYSRDTSLNPFTQNTPQMPYNHSCKDADMESTPYVGYSADNQAGQCAPDTNLVDNDSDYEDQYPSEQCYYDYQRPKSIQRRPSCSRRPQVKRACRIKPSQPSSICRRPSSSIKRARRIAAAKRRARYSLGCKRPARVIKKSCMEQRSPCRSSMGYPNDDVADYNLCNNKLPCKPQGNKNQFLRSCSQNEPSEVQCETPAYSTISGTSGNNPFLNVGMGNCSGKGGGCDNNAISISLGDKRIIISSSGGSTNLKVESACDNNCPRRRKCPSKKRSAQSCRRRKNTACSYEIECRPNSSQRPCASPSSGSSCNSSSLSFKVKPSPCRKKTSQVRHDPQCPCAQMSCNISSTPGGCCVHDQSGAKLLRQWGPPPACQSACRLLCRPSKPDSVQSGEGNKCTSTQTCCGTKGRFNYRERADENEQNQSSSCEPPKRGFFARLSSRLLTKRKSNEAVKKERRGTCRSPDNSKLDDTTSCSVQFDTRSRNCSACSTSRCISNQSPYFNMGYDNATKVIKSKCRSKRHKYCPPLEMDCIVDDDEDMVVARVSRNNNYVTKVPELTRTASIRRDTNLVSDKPMHRAVMSPQYHQQQCRMYAPVCKNPASYVAHPEVNKKPVCVTRVGSQSPVTSYHPMLRRSPSYSVSPIGRPGDFKAILPIRNSSPALFQVPSTPQTGFPRLLYSRPSNFEMSYKKVGDGPHMKGDVFKQPPRVIQYRRSFESGSNLNGRKSPIPSQTAQFSPQRPRDGSVRQMPFEAAKPGPKKDFNVSPISNRSHVTSNGSITPNHPCHEYKMLTSRKSQLRRPPPSFLAEGKIFNVRVDSNGVFHIIEAPKEETLNSRSSKQLVSDKKEEANRIQMVTVETQTSTKEDSDSTTRYEADDVDVVTQEQARALHRSSAARPPTGTAIPKILKKSFKTVRNKLSSRLVQPKRTANNHAARGCMRSSGGNFSRQRCGNNYSKAYSPSRYAITPVRKRGSMNDWTSF